DSAIRMRGRTRPRPIGGLLPQAFVHGTTDQYGRVVPRADDDWPLLFFTCADARLFVLIGAAQDDFWSLVPFPYGALPLLFHLLAAEVDAQLPRPAVDLRILDRRDVDDVIGRGRHPALDHVERVGVEAADDLQ